MTTLAIPGLRRAPRRHRAADRVTELQAENLRLRDALTQLRTERREALDAGGALRVDLADAERVAVCALDELQDRTVERDRLAEQNEGLRLRLAPYLAAEANAAAVTVPPAVRDTTAIEDQATAPVDVRDVRARFADGPVVSLRYSPLAADPAHIPAA
ncbi:hypothetical protein [Streptomyces sp. NBC_00932]|uniref:hypothetical protein n=1 Tax=Streptomyces sp. NBC_00932 TaxID=2903690 RepID=UPI00386F5CBD|nr:hypothetical protein OG221_27545 [Streptomyces sp. NBC_00932]